MITFFQAIVIGLLQGITELFPISSLGHSILVADLFGWSDILSAQTQKGSFYLTFLVAVHVATAIALFIFYRQIWYKIIQGFISSVRLKRISTEYEKLAWLLVVATIPAGLLGLIFESKLRSLFAIPVLAACFLIINGVILLIGDHLRKTAPHRQETREASISGTAHKISFAKAGAIGAAQSLALVAGISRSGITMVSGLLVGLSHESAARFSFLLATPIIFLAGLYKLPELAKPAAHGILGQTLVGALVAGFSAYFAVKFLDKYFQNKRLRPFAIYCFIFGIFIIFYNIVR